MNYFGHLDFATRSEIGLKRKNNEDAFGAFSSYGIWCVADGMGGGDDGEIASAAVVQAIDGFCKEYPMPSDGAFSAWDVSRGVIAAVNSASSWLYRRALERRLKGCGSTFAGVVFDATRPSDALVLHAGDSRVYRIRGKEIQQITKDHSAAELVGVKKESDLNPMFRGMILRAVGIAESVDVDVTPMQINKGDVILLCSDGLSRMISDKKILSVVRENRNDMDIAAQKLIQAVYAAGAVDNVTTILISVRELPLPVKEIHSPINFEKCEDDVEDPITHDTSAETSCRQTSLTEALPIHSDREINTDDYVSMQQECIREKWLGVLRDLQRLYSRKRLIICSVAAVLVLGVFILIFMALFDKDKKQAMDVKQGLPLEVISEGLDNSSLLVTRKDELSDELKQKDHNLKPLVNSVKSTNDNVQNISENRKSSTEYIEDSERKMLVDKLKAERAKMLKAEAEAAAIAERCHKAEVMMGEICSNRVLFSKFIEQMKLVVDSSACANIRMCGQTIATMNPDENGFSAAVCDLVREMQKFDVLLNGKKYNGNFPRRKFSVLAAMDPTSGETYELAAEIIKLVAGAGSR